MRVAEGASGVVVVGVGGGEVCFFFTHFPFFLTWPCLHFLALLCFFALAFDDLAGLLLRALPCPSRIAHGGDRCDPENRDHRPDQSPTSKHCKPPMIHPEPKKIEA